MNGASEKSLFTSQWGKPEPGRVAPDFIVPSLEELALDTWSGFGNIYPGLLSRQEQIPTPALQRSPCLGEAMGAQPGDERVG